MTLTKEIKKKIINIALIAMSVLILVGAVLTICFSTSDKHVIDVTVEADKTKSAHFEELCLRPGESCEYTLSLSGKYTKEYRITLCFEDQNPELTLKDHAYVRMEMGDEVLCDARLSEVLERDSIELDIDFTDGEKHEIKIVYYMTEDVGNEAQNAEADFKLLVTATDK